MSARVTATVVCCILMQILCVVSQKKLQLLGDFRPPDPQSSFMSPPIILWDRRRCSRITLFRHVITSYIDIPSPPLTTEWPVKRKTSSTRPPVLLSHSLCSSATAAWAYTASDTDRLPSSVMFATSTETRNQQKVIKAPWNIGILWWVCFSSFNSSDTILLRHSSTQLFSYYDLWTPNALRVDLLR